MGKSGPNKRLTGRSRLSLFVMFRVTQPYFLGLFQVIMGNLDSMSSLNNPKENTPLFIGSFSWMMVPKSLHSTKIGTLTLIFPKVAEISPQKILPT